MLILLLILKINMALSPIQLLVCNCQGVHQLILPCVFRLPVQKITTSLFCFNSEEIRGEILFVLYRISVIQCASEDGDEADILMAFCPKLLRLTLEALTKTQNDDVRLNCVGLSSISNGFFFNISIGISFYILVLMYGIMDSINN